MYLLYGSAKHYRIQKHYSAPMSPDGMYYEVTYNGDKNECYIDAYKKWQNVCIEM